MMNVKKFLKTAMVVAALLIVLPLQVLAATVPQKVITMGPHATELLVALGLEELIIGTTLNNHSRGPLPEYEAIYEKLPELAFGSASRESVLTSGADYIFGVDWEFGDGGLDIEELQQNGIDVYVEEATTIDEFYQEVRDISQVFDVVEKGEALIDSIQDDLDSVGEVEGEPTKILVYDSGDNGIFTAGASNFETRLIEAAGGKNIFDDVTEKAWVTVSIEDVLERNPEFIIVHDYDVPSAQEKIESIKADSIMSQLEAVKEDRFIILTLESVLPSARIGQTVKTISEAIHP